MLMHRIVLTLLLAATAHQAAAQPGSSHGRELAQGAANLDFIIVNRTRKTIVDLSITPTGERSEWSRDILVQNEVPPTERAAASYTRDIELCRWDIRATFSDRSQQSWRGINLCNTIRVLLR
jgi:hypothetical protein